MKPGDAKKDCAGAPDTPSCAMAARQRLYQDRLLDAAVERGKPVTAYLKNGVHIRGKVVEHDTFTILLETEKNLTLVYKHSITSVFPARLQGARK